MTRLLPTLAEAHAIVAGNPAFTTRVHEVDGLRVHDFGYALPGYMDFERPLADRPELKAYELRGLTFVERSDGTVSRHLMLAKFHALNQTTGSMLKDLAGKRIREVTEKLDGSLVRFIPLGNGKTVARTKSSFGGPHAHLAGSMYKSDPALSGFVNEAHAQGLAPIFELVSPTWKIIVPYSEDRLRLIQIRDEANGEILDIAGHPLVVKYGIETAVVSGMETIDDLMRAQATAHGLEGWVARFDDNTMNKFKTVWYDDSHDFLFEKNGSDKKMLAMVINETMDDVMASMQPDDDRRPAAEEANRLFSNHINQTVRAVQSAVDGFAGSSEDGAARKAFTMAHKGDPLLGLYMQSLKDLSPQAVLALVKGHVQRDGKREDDASRLLAKLRQAELNVSGITPRV